MAGNWQEAKLEDLVVFQRGFDLPQNDRRPGKYPIVASTGIVGCHEEYQVEAPGLIIGRSGSIGGGQYIKKKFWPLNTTLWVKDFKGNDPKFAYYYIRTLDFSIFNAGSGVPTLNRNHIHTLPIKLPSKQEQKAISDVLSSVDDRIQLNQQMNETLEGTAQALFRSWFVDFDPVRAKMEGKKPEGLSDDLAALFPSKIDVDIPSGWREDSIYSCATFINGAAYKNMHFSDAEDALPVIKIAELKAGVGQGTKFTNTDLGSKYLIDSGDILFSWSGSPETSIDTFLWVGGKGWLNQHIFKVVTDSAEMRTFTFFLLKHLKPIFVATAKDKQTTGLGHVTVQDLKRLKAVYPDQRVLKAFAEVATPLLGRIQKNMEQIADLNKIRDSLLPKLISGELRVSDAADFLNEKKSR
jgi:type I restriction enzyme, S subunit